MYALIASLLTALVSLFAAAPTFLAPISPAFSSPRSTCPVSPTRFSLQDILSCYVRILSKSLLRLFGAIKTTLEMPEIVVDAPLVIDQATVSAYRAAIGADARAGGDDGEEHLPLLFTAATSPMFPLLMAHPTCPIAALGSVNTVSKFEMLDPSSARQALQQARKEGGEKGEWNVRAWLGRKGRRVKRGIEFDLFAEVRRGPVGSTDSPVVFRQTFSALQFLPKSHPPAPPSEPAKAEPEKEMEPSEVSLRVDQSHIWHWAGCASDYQPIHISPLLAKYVFGLPTSIAHGNLVVATFLHRLDRPTSSSSSRETRSSATTPMARAREAVFGGGEKGWQVTARFKRPVTVASQLSARFAKVDGDDGVGYELVKGEKPCIEGEVTAL